MKTKLLTLAVLLVGLGLQAQTNSAPGAANTRSEARAGQAAPAVTPPENGGPANPSARPSATPTPDAARPAPTRTEARSTEESLKMRQLSEALAAQKPNPKGLEKHRTSGLFPAFFRTVKSGDNPLQLINPFAPVGKEERDYSSFRSRVYDDPKTHAAPGVDVFSVNF